MKISECPHCGSKEPMYYKQTYSGKSNCYIPMWDENMGYYSWHEVDNSAMYDGASYRMGKVVYCGKCHKRIGSHEDIVINGINKEE